MIRHPTYALTAVVVALILWAPLPFGGVTAWAETSLEIVAFLAVVLSMWALERLANLRSVAIPAIALAGVAVVGALQALAVPVTLVRWLAPGNARLESHVATTLGADVPSHLSLAPQATVSAALLWATAAACLVAGAVAGRRRLERRWLGAGMLLAALVQVFFGARAANAGQRTLWGVEVQITSNRLRGTFFNPNHLALYLEIALALTFAWGWWVARRARTEHALDRRILAVVPPIFVWLTLFSGLVFTQSRGGLLAALVGVIAQGALLATSGRRLAPVFIAAAFGLAGLGAALAMGLQAGPARMLTSIPFDASLGARRQVWAPTLQLWHTSPWVGSGLGTFRDAFTLVQPRGLGSSWLHAHSDPLELLATTGLVGTALVAVGLAGLVWQLLRVLRWGRRSEDRAAGLAALGALTAVGLHECFDFGLTIPASALTLALLSGAAASARLSSTALIANDGVKPEAEAVALLPDATRLPRHSRPRGDGDRQTPES